MPHCRDCGRTMSRSSVYCHSCEDDIITRSRNRLRYADESDQRRMKNDQGYAHSWLQHLIGWIIDLFDMLTKIFSGCFLTSAVVEFEGLSDSSIEMERLRKFRRVYIEESNIRSRTNDLQFYYIIGSVLRNWINSRTDAGLIWEYVSKYVFEVIHLIEIEEYSKAYDYFKIQTLSLKKNIFESKHITSTE